MKFKTHDIIKIDGLMFEFIEKESNSPRLWLKGLKNREHYNMPISYLKKAKLMERPVQKSIKYFEFFYLDLTKNAVESKRYYNQVRVLELDEAKSQFEKDFPNTPYVFESRHNFYNITYKKFKRLNKLNFNAFNR